MSHNKSTKAQKEYVKAIVHQLSLQRLTDTEIVDFLAEKGIVLARNTVNGIKKGIERQAAKWYIELKQSQYKYIANYKERLDSLLSYQKILHGIIATTKKDEIKIRAITELHAIEISIFNLWKQLPDLDIVDRAKQIQQEEQQQQDSPLDEEDINGIEQEPSNPWHDYYKCDGCQRWWRNEKLRDLHRKKSTNPNNECSLYNYKDNIQ